MSEPKLTSPTVIRHLLNQHRILLKKRWGQNFLADENILQLIIAHAQLSPEDWVVEIGAGLGTLTQQIAQGAAQVIAIEIDDRLIPLLKENLRHFPNVTVFHQDFLTLNLEAHHRGQSRRLKVVGNLPYRVTSPILEKLIVERACLESACVMVQREVADKLTAAPGSHDAGAITIFVQAYADVQTLMRVSRQVFFPRPEVDSTLLRMTFLKEPRFGAPEEIFFPVVRASFNLRRKMLKRALAQSPLLAMRAEVVLEALREAQIDPARRGETLTLEEFDRLALALAEREAE